MDAVRGNRVRVMYALILGLVALTLLATSASAADKPYSVVLSNADGSTPATIQAGTTGTVKATYTNLTGQQQLGSSNLTPPAGLSVVSASVAPQGSATIVGGVVQLRNLNAAAGASATVTMQVAAPAQCGTTTHTWPVPVTKQANNFSGPPGNNLNLRAAASDLRTVVAGSGCHLRFGAQPAHARSTQTISSVPYLPSGAPVTVEVVDDGGQPVSGTFSVTVAIGTNPSGGTLSGTKTVTTSSSGVATFSTLSIDKPGAGYTLVATSPSATSATSDPDGFNIDQVAVVCTEDVDCEGSLPLQGANQSQGGSSHVSVKALQGPNPDTDAGFLTLSLGVGGPLDCAGYTELTPDVLLVNYSALDREKYIVATIDKKVMNATSNNGASFLENCFGAPYTFATKPGTPLEVNTAYVPGPYPAPEYKGLLPDCGGSAQVDDPDIAGVSGPLVSNAGPPCVVKRKKSGSGDGIIESIWPSGRQVGFADPRGGY